MRSPRTISECSSYVTYYFQSVLLFDSILTKANGLPNFVLDSGCKFAIDFCDRIGCIRIRQTIRNGKQFYGKGENTHPALRTCDKGSCAHGLGYTCSSLVGQLSVQLGRIPAINQH